MKITIETDEPFEKGDCENCPLAFVAYDSIDDICYPYCVLQWTSEECKIEVSE